MTVARAGRSASPARPPPLWTDVPFDVPCPRCGVDLRGTVTTSCPTCALDIDWDEAVPLDGLTCATCGYGLRGLHASRCPECGDAFTWQTVVERYHSSKSGLFDTRHCPRPLPALWRSLNAWMRPVRMWQRLALCDLPPIKPLLLLVVVALVGLAFWVIAGDILVRVSFLLSWAGWIPLGELVQVCTRLPAVNEPAFMGGCALVAWALSVYASLLLFRQSMGQCRVRHCHVLRVWTYAVVLPIPLFTAVYTAAYCGLLPLVHKGYITEVTLIVGLVLTQLALLGFSSHSLRVAYRDYLKMPHPLGVVFSVQVITLLATFLAAMAIWPDNPVALWLVSVNLY